MNVYPFGPQDICIVLYLLCLSATREVYHVVGSRMLRQAHLFYLRFEGLHELLARNVSIRVCIHGLKNLFVCARAITCKHPELCI